MEAPMGHRVLARSPRSHGGQDTLERLRRVYRSELPKQTSLMHFERLYEVLRRKDKRGADLISDALPFGRLWYGLQSDERS
jgi:hypothetical protein